MNPCLTTVPAARLAFAAGLLGLGLCAGCYDGKKIIDEVRTETQRNRLVEIDLGTYRTTMPREVNVSEATELNLHLFGTTLRYRVPEIEEQIKSDGFRLRHDTIAALRKVTPDELAEPDFARLRARIEEVVNRNLKEAPIQSIGFYDVRLVNQ